MRSNQTAKSERPGAQKPVHYLVGGGIASLSAAVFLIRDAGVRGDKIRIFEQDTIVGGSLDGAGGPGAGYVARGGRMFDKHFVCTFDMLSTVPSIDTEGLTLKDEIDRFNHEVANFSRCRLVQGGRRVPTPRFGLRARDRLDITKLLARSERSLAGLRIEQCFTQPFFATDFWFMWSTTFAFQTWHSAIELRRYFKRFVHLFPGFKHLEGVLRTRYNQYDALIAPILVWLKAHGVSFETGVRVMDVDLVREGDTRRVTALHLLDNGREESLPVHEHDRVFLTLGSMTECSSLGSTAAPPPAPPSESGAWSLWRRLAARDPEFGRPEKFCENVDRTKWESFSVTLCSPAFFDFMEGFTGNVAGTGGLVTFTDSSWLMSIVLFHQPHFRSQPKDAFFFWGYGLHPDLRGDFVDKPMVECSGGEILQELAGHLRLGNETEAFLGDAQVIPCMMPFITSQFMPRRGGDRPQVIPRGARNFAVIGQFCEMPDDVVFTVEYSVRTAMTAVYALTGGGRAPPPVRRTDREPIALLRAVRTLLRG